MSCIIQTGNQQDGQEHLVHMVYCNGLDCKAQFPCILLAQERNPSLSCRNGLQWSCTPYGTSLVGFSHTIGDAGRPSSMIISVSQNHSIHVVHYCKEWRPQKSYVLSSNGMLRPVALTWGLQWLGFELKPTYLEDNEATGLGSTTW